MTTQEQPQRRYAKPVVVPDRLNLCSAARSPAHYWVYDGVQHGQGWTSGTSHASYTQRRAIDSWRITTDNPITTYGAACV
jgi:hypothetical protein